MVHCSGSAWGQLGVRCRVSGADEGMIIWVKADFVFSRMKSREFAERHLRTFLSESWKSWWLASSYTFSVLSLLAHFSTSALAKGG